MDNNLHVIKIKPNKKHKLKDSEDFAQAAQDRDRTKKLERRARRLNKERGL